MTLTEYEAAIAAGPSYGKLGAGAAYVLRARLNQGEAWSAGLLAAVADAHRQPLRISGQEDAFRALTAA